MGSYRVEAVILQTVRYGEGDQIVTAFSRESGILKLIFKSKRVSTLSPLSRVELVYQKGRGDLYRGSEVVVLDSYLPLRENFAQLQAGCDLLEAVRLSQVGEREAPLLYALLCLYLSRLHEVKDPGAVVVSFYLKSLKHEGLLSDDILRSLNDEEQLLVQVLAGCRRVADFADLLLPNGFVAKIKQTFLSYCNASFG